MQEVLKSMYKKIDHFCLKCTGYILKKIVLKKELKKLLKKVSQLTWDAAIQAAHLQS